MIALSTLSGCTNSEDEPDPDDKPQNEVVIAAYTGYWPVLLKASDPPDPESPALADVAAAPELDRARAVLAARLKANQVVRGSYEHDVQVESISDSEAKLTDCLTVRTSSYDATTKKVDREDPRGPFPISVALMRDGDVWKVTDVASGSRACSPSQTPTPSPEGS